MVVLLIIGTIAFITPTHKIYYVIHLNKPLNQEQRKHDYKKWNTYSRFLYFSGEYAKSLKANKKAIEAARKIVKMKGDSTIIYKLQKNRSKIKNRNWVNSR
jgi:hypothetical protein